MGARKKGPAEAFGQVLQELRAERGLTQETLAHAANTERSHISALEWAEKGPTLATILSVAAAVGMTGAELVARVERKLKKP